MRLKSVLASWAVISIIGCSTENPGAGTKASAPPETSAPPRAFAVTTDAWEQRERALKETIARNRRKPVFTGKELHTYMGETGSKAHLQLWRDLHSYYALLAIVEGIIEPEAGRIRRKDIEELLGKGNPDYPGANGRMLEYVGDRSIPAGAHLLVHFDDTDVVDGLDWVSE